MGFLEDELLELDGSSDKAVRKLVETNHAARVEAEARLEAALSTMLQLHRSFSVPVAVGEISVGMRGPRGDPNDASASDDVSDAAPQARNGLQPSKDLVGWQLQMDRGARLESFC